MFKFFYKSLIHLGDSFQNFFLLLIRILWGWLFFSAGLRKLSDISTIADFFQSLHIPFPLANAYLVGSFEMIGGALLVLGLFLRLITLPLICIMIVAFLTAHLEPVIHFFSEPTKLFKASPFTFLLASLMIFIFGPGKISLDALFKIEKQ